MEWLVSLHRKSEQGTWYALDSRDYVGKKFRKKEKEEKSEQRTSI